jgi:hypothetical protein
MGGLSLALISSYIDSGLINSISHLRTRLPKGCVFSSVEILDKWVPKGA